MAWQTHTSPRAHHPRLLTGAGTRLGPSLLRSSTEIAYNARHFARASSISTSSAAGAQTGEGLQVLSLHGIATNAPFHAFRTRLTPF